MTEKAKLISVTRWAVVPALAFLIVSALWMQVPWIADQGSQILSFFQQRLGETEFLTSFDKTYLAPIRLLHILTLAYVLSAWPRLQLLAESPRAAPFVIMGRNALPVFAAGSVLVYIVQIFREAYSTSSLVDVVSISICLNLQLLLALFADVRKRRGKSNRAI